MKIMGKQVIAELWDCNLDILNDADLLKRIFVDAAMKAGAEVREVTFHQFVPHGLSGVVIISESHLTIHSFPEHRYASIDIYTCGTKVEPMVAVEYIVYALESKTNEIKEIPRGMGPVKPRLVENRTTLELLNRLDQRTLNNTTRPADTFESNSDE